MTVKTSALWGVSSQELSPLLSFMYLGHATFDESRINEFLAVAEDLQVKELCNYQDTEKQGCYTTMSRMDCVPVDLWHGWYMSHGKGKVDNPGKPSVLRCSDTSRMHVYILLTSLLSRFLRVSWVFCFRTWFQQKYLTILVGMMICSMDFRISDRKEDLESTMTSKNLT